jgi:hypothetical protein
MKESVSVKKDLKLLSFAKPSSESKERIKIRELT